MHKIRIIHIELFDVAAQGDHGVSKKRQGSPYDTTEPIAVLMDHEPASKHEGFSQAIGSQ